MTGTIGVVAHRFLKSHNKAMFCSSNKCCDYISVRPNGIKQKVTMSKILVSFDMSVKKCKDCSGDLFISNYNTKTPKKENV